MSFVQAYVCVCVCVLLGLYLCTRAASHVRKQNNPNHWKGHVIACDLLLLTSRPLSNPPSHTHTHLFGIINLAGKPYQTTGFSSIFHSTDLPWIELVDDALEPDHRKQPAGESAQPGQQQDGERYQAGVAGRLPKGGALGGPIHADGQRACRAKGNWEGSVSGRLLLFHVTVLSTPTHTHTRTPCPAKPGEEEEDVKSERKADKKTDSAFGPFTEAPVLQYF